MQTPSTQAPQPPVIGQPWPDIAGNYAGITTAALSPIPAWTYQPPRHPAGHESQCYYRADQYHRMEGTPTQLIDGSEACELKLYRWTSDTTCRLTLTLDGIGELRGPIDAKGLLTLRDACADALQDIAQVEADRLRRESLDEIREDMARAEDLGATGSVLYAHPDVHYVATQAEAEAKLASIDMGIVIVREGAPA